MRDDRKTKRELIRELTNLRAKLKRIEKRQDQRKRLCQPAVANDSADIGYHVRKCGHKLANDTLRSCNERFVTVFSASLVAIAIRRLEDNRLIEVNQAWSRMTGFSEEEAIGTTSAELNILVNDGMREEVLQKLRDGEKVEHFDYLLRRKSGEIANALLSAELIEFGGEPCVLTIAQDITERKRMEKALCESEERYRGLVEGSSEAIAVHCGGSIAYVNSAGAKLFGAQSPEELFGKSILDLTHPESRKGALERIEQMPLGHAVRLNAKKFVRLDGNAIDVEVTLIPTTVLGKPAVQVMLRDVTEQKQAERQLREAKDQYQQLVENINEVIFSLDDGGIITYVSPAIGVVGGYLPAELIGRPFSEFVLPEDFTIAYNGFRRTIQGELGQSEFRVLTKSGQVRWMRTSGRPIVRQGNAAGMSGVLNDITEDKWAKEGLALLGQTVRSIRECVSVTDKNDKILFVNDAFLKTYGYTSGEVIGKPISIVRSRTTESAAEDVLQPTLQGGWQGELINRRKDGSEFPISLSTSIIRNDEGRLLGLVGIAADISERKRAEEALLEAHARIESILSCVADTHILLDRNWRYLYVNEAAVSSIGRPRNQILGRTLWELYPDILGTELERQYRRAMEERVPVQFEYHNPAFDSWWDNRFYPAVEGLAVFASDITERKRAEHLIEEERNLLRSIINAIPDEIVVKDLERKFVLANEACVRALGKQTPDQVMGFRDEDLIAEPFARDARKKEIHVLTSGDTIFNEMPEPRRNPDTGKLERAIMTTKTPLHDRSGRTIGLVTVNRDVTELRSTLEALSQSEDRFRTVWDHSLAAMRLTDADGNIVMVNQSFCQLFKKESEELVGHSLADAYLSKPNEYISEQYREHFQYRSIAPSLEADVTIWNGEELRLELSNTFLSVPNQAELLLSVFRDITERKHAEDKLRFQATLLNAVGQAVIATNGAGIVTYLNSAAESLYGWPADQALGRNILDVIVPQVSRAQGAEMMSQLVRGKSWSGEFLVQRRYGATFPSLVHDSPIRDGDGKLIGVISISSDITERRRAEELLIASQNELHLLAGHLQSVREEERKHLSQEFHDQLGQTLTALNMDLALLQRDLADKTKEVSRSAIAEKMRSMHELIDGGTQSIREIMSELHPELLDQLGLVTALEWEAERFQKRSGMKCRFTSLLDEFPIDPQKSIALFRIFQEAVTNVARHAHATLIEINLRRENGEVLLEIRDNGIGIEPSAEHKPRSFGLIGMRERAILLRGTLEITGNEGKGTTILVRMPYDQTLPEGGLVS